jgi:hypothetical protein
MRRWGRGQNQSPSAANSSDLQIVNFRRRYERKRLPMTTVTELADMARDAHMGAMAPEMAHGNIIPL